jgi:hypothetical protein
MDETIRHSIITYFKACFYYKLFDTTNTVVIDYIPKKSHVFYQLKCDDVS